MMYRPSNSVTERLKALFKKRIGDGEIAYLGDSVLPGARVDVPGRPGYVYVRFPYGRDANGFTLFTPPTMARSAGVAYPNVAGTGVYVAVKYNNELELVSAHYASMDRMGINTATLNPLNQQSKWVYLWQLTTGLAMAVATSRTASTLVMVKSIRNYIGGDRFQTFETPLQADKIDLSSYIPTTDMHCYAAVWIDTFLNVAVVTTSVAQALNVALDSTDLQEVIVRAASSRPPDGQPLKAFYLSNAQGTIKQSALDVDIRPLINTPQIWGFPNVLATLERIWPNRTLVTGPFTTTGVGAVDTSETGAQHIIVHKNNWTATTSPTVNDDSGDGYSVGSTWFDKSTGLFYVAEDVTVGAAVWTVANSGSSGMTSFNIDSDFGTGTITDGDTLGFSGLAGITTSIVGTTVTIDGSFIPAPPFVDTTAIVKGSSDATKLLRFEVDGFTTATTRVMTPPNYDGTLSTLAGAETLTNKTLTSPIINTGVSGSAISDDPTFASPSSTIVPTTNAVKGYVDQTVLGLNAKADVRLATVAALPAVIYANGTSGVGATLTGVATGVLTIDGVTVALNNRLLIKDQIAGLQNGIYVCTVAGAIGVAFILTRATDGDTDGELRGAWMVCVEGTTNATQAFVNTNTTAITFGATAITFGEFSAGVIAVTTPIVKTANTLSLDSTVLITTTAQNTSNKTITASTIDSTPIGTTTRALGYFSALREYIGGFAAIFTHANTADRMYTFKDASGTVAFTSDIPTSAPVNATYLVQVADGTLTNEQAMGALATGIVYNTTTTGVQSIAVAGTNYTSPTGTENLSNKAITTSSLIASALSLLIGGFKGIFTHANTADRTYTLQNVSGTLALTSDLKSVIATITTVTSILSYTATSDTFMVDIICIGGGGGGGSGRRGATSTTRSGGGGGAAGAYTRKRYPASVLGGIPYTVTAGTGGGGGAARTANDTSGANGSPGANSTFGTLLTAIGGLGGQGGTTSTGIGGVGNLTVGPSFDVYGSSGGSASPSSTTQPGADGPGGGGSGGFIDNTNAVVAGSTGARGDPGFAATTTGGGGSGGSAAAGSNGANGNTTGTGPIVSGAGGGGGGPNAGVGTVGGNGGANGGGGGGGSGSTNGANSGAGGDGGMGAVIIIAYRFA